MIKTLKQRKGAWGYTETDKRDYKSYGDHEEGWPRVLS